ncbi:Nn.00g007310.m01.CDS01 [Neocucurbitaria sp. VM-36]
MAPYDLTGHTICEQCKVRYVQPTENHKTREKVGQKHTKCAFCRRLFKKDDFPPYLMVADDDLPSNVPSLPVSSYDLTGHTVCEKCKIRYVQPTDHHKTGQKKGERHTKCGVCRRLFKADKFPSHLIVAEDKMPEDTTPVAPTEEEKPQTTEEMWLASLSLEQQSILIHPHTMMKRFPPTTALADLPRASPQIQWEDISTGLRNICSPDRLFTDFVDLLKYYATNRDIVSPISFIAVSLNNVAIRENSPFRFCWLDIPFNQGTATLFMSFGARSSAEKLWWTGATPEQRMKVCSTWESDIRKSAKAIAIQYNSVESRTVGQDGNITVPPEKRTSLLWVHKTFDHNNVQGPGELLFPNNKRLVKDRCSTSVDLLGLLSDHYHQDTSKHVWSELQQEALGEMARLRIAKPKVQAVVTQLITEKRRQSQMVFGTVANDISDSEL